MTTVSRSASSAPGSGRVAPLLRAAHLGPSLAVTTVVSLLAVGRDLPAYAAVVVTAAVLAGQLTIGWGNDLLDAPRDRAVGRPDKPLANGELAVPTARTALVVAAVACVVLSFLVGWRSAVVHLGLGVAMGHLYNLVLKRTVWSWLPYAIAFASLPVLVSLAGPGHPLPPWWMPAAAAALGVAAHLLNVLPDLADDAATGVRGLPHRLGATATRVVATVLLVSGSVVAVLGPAGTTGPLGWVSLVVVVALAAIALTGRGRVPFVAAVGIALVDVVLLTVAGP